MTAGQGDPAAPRPDRVNVISRSSGAEPEEAVAAEARKGYDFLVIGIEHVIAPDGSFHQDVNRIAAGFAGPFAIVVARGHHILRPMESDFKILVPVTATSVSRRAVQVAATLARATRQAVTALYVAGGDGKSP